MSPSTAPVRPTVSALRLGTWCAFALAAGLLAIWLWSRYCRFPSVPWNDMRLAPTIALAQGWPVYPTAHDGTVSTWMYGPLPVLFFWPASWASTAADAIMIAAGMNMALTLVPIALVCFAWPAADHGTDTWLGRALAFLLCLAVWPELHYSVLFSDNLAVACGLVGNLLLVRARGQTGLWLAALIATAAVACKQICLGIPLAQVIWLGVTIGPREALRHAGRCVVAGTVIAVAAIAIFGAPGLWHTLVAVPGRLGWAPDVAQRLRAVAPELLLHAGLPAFVMVAGRRAFSQPRLLLPALAWICTLPLGLAGMMKVGGWTNSIHSFVLWTPAVLATLFTTSAPDTRRWTAYFTAAIAAAALTCGRVLHESDLTLRPQTSEYHVAAQLAARQHHAVWFPVHPLVTLYSDHRYYHDEDGMYARFKAGMPISPAHAATQLPPGLRAIVFRNDWSDWGIARRMMPAQTQDTVIGNWTLRIGVAAAAPP
ncbi:hypothetical protein [Horticoccus sp. 23ND18S-11]|uniref:hypothetical protein n=1 Tax=Horticoccus sp. 23ND18S-11 TaxID=3391832 RepID=UPI0039C9B96B